MYPSRGRAAARCVSRRFRKLVLSDVYFETFLFDIRKLILLDSFSKHLFQKLVLLDTAFSIIVFVRTHCFTVFPETSLSVFDTAHARQRFVKHSSPQRTALRKSRGSWGCTKRRRRETRDFGSGSGSVGANNYPPEVTKVKFHRKTPPKIHWTVLVTVHWESDNPLEIQLNYCCYY